MTHDPNSLGGFDLRAMLEQAQQKQAQLMSAQAELASRTVDGSSGGVQGTLSGTRELVGVRFPTGTFDTDDAESLAALGDLVVAAFRDAKAKADALASDALGPLAGGLSGDGGLGGLMGGSPGV